MFIIRAHHVFRIDRKDHVAHEEAGLFGRRTILDVRDENPLTQFGVTTLHDHHTQTSPTLKIGYA